MQLTVFCSARENLRPQFYQLATLVGQQIALRGHSLIYGGEKLGLMGRLADGALEKGGLVTGVIPQFLVEQADYHRGLNKIHIVQTMHERKRLLADWGDAYIALPGGLGTLEELIEMLTLKLMGQHNKPIVLMDSGGFWHPLLAFFDHLFAERMIPVAAQKLYHVCNDLEQVFAVISKRE